MLLTLSTTFRPATDLGHLLHKHPDSVRSVSVSAGQAHVFFPEAEEERCTAALLLEVDPVGLVTGRRGRAGEGFSLGQYVNDRGYVASSLLAVALASVFRTALRGRCDARPDLVTTALPLEVNVPVLPCDGAPDLARRLFEPLGWTVFAEPIPLDPAFPAWGTSRYVSLRLVGELTVAAALGHLYVLLPVLDDAKHYWVGSAEVDKLVRTGGEWLAVHPERELITRRYLAHQRTLATAADAALVRLAEADGRPDDEPATPSTHDRPHDVADDRVPSLARQRIEAVLEQVRAVDARRVVDVGCGEGRLLRELVADRRLDEVVGVDVSPRALETAARRLRLDQLPEPQRERVRLLQSALTYVDDRLVGYDAAVLAEVIEHVDPYRLPAVERALFGHARPGTVVVTTPNREYNVRWASLPAGQMRHPDHRFEWTRDQFADWAARVAEEYGYRVRLLPIGPEEPDVGAPTQAGVFHR